MWLSGSTLAEKVEECIKAGATFVQLREKDLEFDAFVALAKEVKVITDRYNIPFVIDGGTVRIGKINCKCTRVK